MIHVLAIITTQPGQRDAVLEQFRANMPAVLAEPGCIEYAPAIDAAALKAHAAAPHMASYGARVKEMLASRVIHVLSPA